MEGLVYKGGILIPALINDLTNYIFRSTLSFTKFTWKLFNGLAEQNHFYENWNFS